MDDDPDQLRYGAVRYELLIQQTTDDQAVKALRDTARECRLRADEYPQRRQLGRLGEPI